MLHYPTRSEERQERFYFRAEHGLFSSEEILYPREVKDLIRKGFKVTKVNDFDTNRNLATYKVSWELAYGYSIPHIVHSYIAGVIKTFPHAQVTNFPQELYIISSTVNY